MTPVLAVLWCMFFACENAPDTARSMVQKPTAEVVYARGREALTANGITRLRWALTPFVSPTSVENQWRPTLDLVSSRMGIPIDTVVGDGYKDVEQALIEGRVDIAIMSPYGYVRAKALEPEIRVFSTHIANGTESYGAYIVTRDDSPIQSVSDLRNRRFAFVDERSSSGWLFPASRLLDEGINPTIDVKGAFFGSHEKVIRAVVDGRAAAGATYDSALTEGRGRIPRANTLRIVARTHRIPYDAYVARPGFPLEAIVALQKALNSVSTRDPVGRKALMPLVDINGFIRADASHYRTVREVEAQVRTALENTEGELPIVIQPTPIQPPEEADEHSPAHTE